MTLRISSGVRSRLDCEPVRAGLLSKNDEPSEREFLKWRRACAEGKSTAYTAFRKHVAPLAALITHFGHEGHKAKPILLILGVLRVLQPRYLAREWRRPLRVDPGDFRNWRRSSEASSRSKTRNRRKVNAWWSQTLYPEPARGIGHQKRQGKQVGMPIGRVQGRTARSRCVRGARSRLDSRPDCDRKSQAVDSASDRRRPARPAGHLDQRDPDAAGTPSELAGKEFFTEAEAAEYRKAGAGTKQCRPPRQQCRGRSRRRLQRRLVGPGRQRSCRPGELRSSSIRRTGEFLR